MHGVVGADPEGEGSTTAGEGREDRPLEVPLAVEEGEPLLEQEPEQPAEPDTVMRVVIDPAEARAFARRCAKVVAAGRPPCPFCGGPLDPTGHICPRANGYKR